MLTYNVKETAPRFATFEPDMKQSRGIQANEALDVLDHVLLAKRIKLRYSASMFRFFDTSFEASVSNVTSLVISLSASWKRCHGDINSQGSRRKTA